MKYRRRFVAYFHCSGDISLGISVSLTQPNLEIHVPFGFFRIGWSRPYILDEFHPWLYKHWGYDPK